MNMSKEISLVSASPVESNILLKFYYILGFLDRKKEELFDHIKVLKQALNVRKLKNGNDRKAVRLISKIESVIENQMTIIGNHFKMNKYDNLVDSNFHFHLTVKSYFEDFLELKSEINLLQHEFRQIKV
ncbi:uncharacterized protein [Rhodnius prolixus]|uniref:uncharacterized protein n=1 Tax=Rhodnius prolixus TaxID=13249 RepID=UPI003D18E484